MPKLLDESTYGRFESQGEPMQLRPTTAMERMSLTGWWRASFAGDDWSGSPSIGPSGGRLLTDGTPPASTSQFRGTNLAGFGAQGYWGGWSGANVGTRSPGNGPTFPTNFPGRTTAEIDYLVGKGMNAFRLLFVHEAMQPEAYAAIPYAGSGVANPSRYATYYTNFKAIADYITLTHGCRCLIDIHNASPEMCTYYDQPFRVSPGAGEEDADVLADVWARLATIFLANPLIEFGIHNEPNQTDGYSVASWFGVAQVVIDAIRATGNTSKIWVPGLDFTASRAFVFNGSAAAFEALTDSANNLGVQVHLYLDQNNSGAGTTFNSGLSNEHYGSDITSNQSYEPRDRDSDGVAAADIDVAPARLRAVTEWAEARGTEIMVTEIAVSPWNSSNVDQTVAKSQPAWDAFIDYVNEHPATIKGWHWWIYGYAPKRGFDLMQESGVDSPRMDIIEADIVASVTTPASFEFTGPFGVGGMLALWRPVDATLSGTQVLTVPDSSGAGISARNLAKVGGTGPTIVATSANMNGQTTVSTANTANRRLQCTFETTHAQPYTMYRAIHVVSNPATAFWGTNAGNYDNSPGFTLQTDLKPRAQVKTTGAAAISAPNAIATGTHIVAIVYGGSSSLIYVDDHTVPVASGTLDSLGLLVHTIGSFGTAVQMEWGDIAIYSGRHDSPTRRALMKFWGDKYGRAIT